MSRVEHLLSSLRRDGVDVWVEEESYDIEPPRRALADEQLAEIEARKEEIISFCE